MSVGIPPLAAERLCWRCDPADLPFTTTADLAPLERMVGQDRGVGALEFGLDLETRGYNVYVAGPTGTGRMSTVCQRVRRLAAARAAPADWCYVHNFADPYQPAALMLPTGRGPEVARDVDRLIADCRREITKAFESEDYARRQADLIQGLRERRDHLFEELRTFAERLGFTIQVAPTGIITAPMLGPNQPMSSEAFELLPTDKQAEIRLRGQQLERRVEDVLLQVRRLERETHEQMHALERQAALFAVGHLLEALRAKYADLPRVVQHLEALQADLMEHLDELHRTEAPSDAAALLGSPTAWFERYRVNVLVTHDPAGGAPVVFEPNPTYYNLLGRIDYRAAIGAMHTDFTLIKAGALQRANGGFLVLQARDLLLSPFAWDALKRALRDGEVRVEKLGEQLSAFPTTGLKPEPIPLSTKVILIGDLTTHLLLYRLDEDFHKLFKVKAQFGPYMDRTPDAILAYAAFVAEQVRQHALPPFHRDAVARVVEYGARLAEHQEHLATRFNAVAELVIEAAYRARRAHAAQVEAAHVGEALREQEHRANLAEEEAQRLITEGTVDITTQDAVVGQVNGLAVLDLGDYTFARPSRITARVGMGARGVVNIEREVEMSGPVHSKGVLILGGYLLGQYAQEWPLALSAQLVFEQVYDDVDGDSASSAELYALLSALAEAPLRQGIAVTGSVNQRGEVQAVGAVTRKIEGFFAVCRARGLTGNEGVIIPATNARHLMLESEVVDAVARGQFHVWAVRTIDEGIALLTGLPAGERQPDGKYPAGTIHARVQQRLAGLATRLAGRGGYRKLAQALATDGVHVRRPQEPCEPWRRARRAGARPIASARQHARLGDRARRKGNG